MNNPRVNARKTIEQREKEFCNHFNNANAELAHNIRKNKPGSRKGKHPGSKKVWGSENQPENLPQTNEIEGKPQNEAAPVKRERKGWGVPRPNPVELQEQQEIKNMSNEKRSESPLKEIQKENYSSNTSNEDIVVKKNFDSVGSQEEVSIENKENKDNKDAREILTSFKSLDLQKLRQQKKEEKLKQAGQKPDVPRDSPIIQKLAELPEIPELKQSKEKSKRSVKSDSLEEEIEEEIAEDINDEPVEPVKEVSKPSNRLDSSYGKKPVQPVLKRVNRPLTANVSYNSNFRPADPVLANIPSKGKQIESKKTLEPKKTKNNEQELKLEDSGKLVQKEKTKNEQVPEKKNPLIKRVESLDEPTKKLLANILEKIETGSFDKEDFENLEEIEQ